MKSSGAADAPLDQREYREAGRRRSCSISSRDKQPVRNKKDFPSTPSPPPLVAWKRSLDYAFRDDIDFPFRLRRPSSRSPGTLVLSISMSHASTDPKKRKGKKGKERKKERKKERGRREQ